MLIKNHIICFLNSEKLLPPVDEKSAIKPIINNIILQIIMVYGVL